MTDIGQSLRAVLDDEEQDFFFILRSTLTWDVGAFERLEKAIYATLSELRGREDVPRWIAGFFANYLWGVAGIGARDDLRVVRGGVDVPDGSVVVRDACARIRNYQHWLEWDALPYGSSVPEPNGDAGP